MDKLHRATEYGGDIIFEAHKKRGLCYVVTDDGIEVSVIDLTHPEFQDALSPRELEVAVQKAAADVEARGRMSADAMAAQVRELLRGSFLAPRIAAAQGKVLGGMSTYYLKLGPGNLPSAVAADVDRAIAGSLPCVSARLRMRHMAHLLGDAVASLLRARPGMTLRMVNIAGGPCMDSLNALLLLAVENPTLLTGRRVVIDSLDTDASGPALGARALEALRLERAVLSGVSFVHTPYDWSRHALSEVLPRCPADGGLVAGSTEGGLFEYGTDEEILANLQALRAWAPSDAVFVGSVTRTDGVARVLNSAGGAALRTRSRDAFQAIVNEAGWRISRTEESPLSYEVSLSIIG